MQRKHVLGFALVVALVISSVGLLTVGAQDKEPAWLGVAIIDSDAGVVIMELTPGGPADTAGVQADDVVQSVNDTAVTDVTQFVDLIASFAPGDEIALVVLRGDEEVSLPVELGSRPDDIDFTPGPTIQMRPGMHGEMMLFGMQMSMTDKGVVIDSIDEGSPLADAGLEPGDVVVAINGEPVEDLLPRIMMQSMWQDAVTFTVQRDGEELDVTVNFADLLGDFEHPPFDMNVIEVQRPLQLGVQFRTLTAEIAAEEDLSVEEGALLTEVLEGTPAADADLQVGDVITAVDGDLVDEEHTLTDRLYAYENSDVVTLTVLRDGEELDVEVTLGPNPRDVGVRGMFGMPFMPGMQGGNFEFGPGMMMPFQNNGRSGRNNFGFGYGQGQGRSGRNNFGFGYGQGQGRGFRFHFDTPDDTMPDAVPDQGTLETMPDANNTGA